jgi:FKBP12-rapamycin complex-associated protein
MKEMVFILTVCRSNEEKERACQDLRRHLLYSSTQMPKDQFTRYNNELNRRLFDVLRNADPNTRMGAIMAVDTLIDNDTGEEQPVKITRFANYIRTIILTNDIEVLKACARTMGRLTQFSALSGEIVEFEIKRAIEWLQSDRQEVRRHAAVLEIKWIATYNPTLLYSYVGTILDNIWIALRDPKVTIRVDAASALNVCLDILRNRDNDLRQRWYNKMLNEAQFGFKIGTLEAIHGSLLVYKELLSNVGTFMQTRYTDVCETVLKFKDHKDPLVRRTVIEILPDLARYNPSEFTKRYLVDSMSHLIGQLKKEKDKSIIFASIGKIAESVRSNMAFYLEPILENVREGLSAKG